MTKDNSLFLITIAEDDDEVITEVFAYDSLKLANEQLHELSYCTVDEDRYRMYHGVLLEAFYIPNNLKGCKPYVIIRNPERLALPVTSDEGWFHEAPTDSNMLSQYIKNLIDKGNIFRKEIKINDVFIFYGKQLSPALHVVEEEINDDELIDRWNKLEANISLNISLFEKKDNNGHKSKSAAN